LGDSAEAKSLVKHRYAAPKPRRPCQVSWLIGYEATCAQVAAWDLRRRVEAVIYAGTEHARASDNPVTRHPRPSWLPERPWQGPSRCFGVFAGPGGTSIEEVAHA
jgi:hypothetical protein